MNAIPVFPDNSLWATMLQKKVPKRFSRFWNAFVRVSPDWISADIAERVSPTRLSETGFARESIPPAICCGGTINAANFLAKEQRSPRLSGWLRLINLNNLRMELFWSQTVKQWLEMDPMFFLGCVKNIHFLMKKLQLMIIVCVSCFRYEPSL